jgi:hypothetical protein
MWDGRFRLSKHQSWRLFVVMLFRKLYHLALITLGCLLSPVLRAQQPLPPYFPLQAGNSWLFHLAQNETATENVFRSISVEGIESIGGREYFTVRYFDKTVPLRANPDGSIVAFNRTSSQEEPWLAPGLPVGSTFESHIDQCTRSGRIESRDADILKLPIGNYSNAVQISFQGQCTDAGITQQYYLPGIGPVIHEETSFAGPRRYELVYVRSGGFNVTGRELSFNVSLDAARYTAGTNMGVRLTLRSINPEPLMLVFPSGQSYELKIFNETGEAVYVWSAGRQFPMTHREERFGPGERTYGFAAPLPALPPGRYKAQGYLTTSPVMYLGEVSFEIVSGQP